MKIRKGLLSLLAIPLIIGCSKDFKTEGNFRGYRTIAKYDQDVKTLTMYNDGGFRCAIDSDKDESFDMATVFSNFGVFIEEYTDSGAFIRGVPYSMLSEKGLLTSEYWKSVPRVSLEELSRLYPGKTFLPQFANRDSLELAYQTVKSQK